MVTADHAPIRIAVQSLTGVRQRVLLALLAAALAVVTQPRPADPPPDGMQGFLNIPIELGGEHYRLACQGNGDATVVFLESAETSSQLTGSAALSSSRIWFQAQSQVASYSRVCALYAASVSAQSGLLAPAMTDQIAADLVRVLGERMVPSPYIIVSPAELAPLTVALVEGNAALVSGGLVLELAADPVTGWTVRPDENASATTLMSVDDLALAIRSLVWPPRSV